MNSLDVVHGALNTSDLRCLNTDNKHIKTIQVLEAIQCAGNMHKVIQGLFHACIQLRKI